MYSPDFVPVTNHQLYSIAATGWTPVKKWSSPTPSNPLKSYILVPSGCKNRKCIWSDKQFVDNTWYYKFTKESRMLVFEYLMQLITYTKINEYIIVHDSVSFLCFRYHFYDFF